MYQDVTNKWRWKGWGARETANIPKIIYIPKRRWSQFEIGRTYVFRTLLGDMSLTCVKDFRVYKKPIYDHEAWFRKF